jgi:hypothetical protein
VLVDDRLQLDRLPKHRIVLRLAADPAVTAELESNHRAVSDPAIRLVDALVDLEQVAPDKAEHAALVSGQCPQDFLVAVGTVRLSGTKKDADLLDPHPPGDLQQHPVRYVSEYA